MRRALLSCLSLAIGIACGREPEPVVDAAPCGDATDAAVIDVTDASSIADATASDVGIDTTPDVTVDTTPPTPRPLDACTEPPQRTPTAEIPTAMGTAYAYAPHALTLPDGRIFAASGGAWSFATWDPKTDTWTSIDKPSLDLKHSFAPAIIARLHDDVILAAGGYGCPPKTCRGSKVATTYDVKTGTWTPRADMPFELARTATVVELRTDDVLVQAASGGWYRYDATKDTWTKTALAERARSAATKLDDGRVLITGGYMAANVVTDLVESFDPKSGTIVTAASMKSPRFEHVAVRLRDGRVLVAGGLRYVDGASTNQAEIYDPATNTWRRVAPMPRAHTSQSAALLPCGGVLVVGGDELGLLWPTPGTVTPAPRHPIDEPYVYLPSMDTWTTLPLPVARSRAAITPLAEGSILVVGGEESDEAATSADVWR